ncbi:hypothetical protein [Marilutibacter chinensis]|uniref:Uncharacterized protein n=1 Tax=Marilutibacter chinensis TaxID=2912247 RepID=A0ABS9HZS9_9GAMM|nr:hypothetical protein [Lysobacter chinensis]MCF7223872.1 hypothetical protein [Lysobacter chinensis]
MSLLVYLDSQDYSKLTKDNDLLQELASCRESGEATFISSSVIVSECAPLTASVTHLAVERSEVIELLCGRNTFISIDRILETEISSFGQSPPTRDLIISSKGDWFPSVGPLLDEVDMRKSFQEALSDRPLNREQRRKAKSMTLRGGSLRSRASNELLSGMDDLAKEAIAAYPMKPENARTVISFIAGKASRAQAERALLESLRDVSWMMRWFQNHHDNLAFVPNFIRATSNRTFDRFSESIEKSKLVDDPIRAWRQIADDVLQESIENFIAKSGKTIKPSAAEIQKHCPGMAAMFKLMAKTIEDSLGSNTRNLNHSDFADAIHALHAPYVDIFRTDAYMASKLTAIASGTTICRKLRELPSAIRMASEVRT